MACYARINIAYGLLSPLAPVFPPSQEDHLSVGKKPTKRKGVLCFECCFVLFPVARSESWFLCLKRRGARSGSCLLSPAFGLASSHLVGSLGVSPSLSFPPLSPSLPPREPDLGPVCFSGRRRLLRFWQIRSVFTVCRFTSWLLVEFSGCQIEKIEKNNNKTQRETLERTNLAATVFVGCCARSDVVM